VTRHAHVIVESFCYSCNRVWSGRNAGVVGRAHAEHTGHRVRVTRTIVIVYNMANGKAKVTK
jgi:hypothetical protein